MVSPFGETESYTVHERRKRLGAAVTYVREGRPTSTGDGRVDTDLLPSVEEPYSTPGEARRRLSELHEMLESREDRRAVFLAIYARVTAEVADRIDRGEFEDPAWVADYLVAFANLYRRALYEFESGNYDRLPDPWQVAFETAREANALVVQDAVLGINAHINYDLAFALDEVGVDPDRNRKYADHRAVTDVLRELVDETQDSLAGEYAPGIGTVDESLGRLDERAAIFTIDQCRDSAWRNAVAMNSRFRLRRRLARWITHATSAGIARLVLTSRASVTVHDALREFEGDPDTA